MGSVESGWGLCSSWIIYHRELSLSVVPCSQFLIAFPDLTVLIKVNRVVVVALGSVNIIISVAQVSLLANILDKFLSSLFPI
jgi:hypothetical protein